MHVAANKMPGDNIAAADATSGSTSLRSLAPVQTAATDVPAAAPAPSTLQTAPPIGSTTGLNSISSGSKRGITGDAGSAVAAADVAAATAAVVATAASKRGIDSSLTSSKRGVADTDASATASASKRNVTDANTASTVPPASSTSASEAATTTTTSVTTADAPVAPAAAPVNQRQGWMTVSAFDGKGWDNRFARLDANSRLLLLFDNESMAAGTERAAIDLLSVHIIEDAPPGAPSVAGVPTFWMALEDSGVFGPTKSGKPTPATAFQLKNDAEKAEWLKVLHSSSDRASPTPSDRTRKILFLA